MRSECRCEFKLTEVCELIEYELTEICSSFDVVHDQPSVRWVSLDVTKDCVSCTRIDPDGIVQVGCFNMHLNKYIDNVDVSGVAPQRIHFSSCRSHGYTLLERARDNTIKISVDDNNDKDGECQMTTITMIR